MWTIVRLVAGWLIGMLWKMFWKKPINWGSKAKALLPIIARVITWRQRKADAATPTPGVPTPDGTDMRPGWRLRRLFKRFRP